MLLLIVTRLYNSTDAIFVSVLKYRKFICKWWSKEVLQERQMCLSSCHTFKTDRLSGRCLCLDEILKRHTYEL